MKASSRDRRARRTAVVFEADHRGLWELAFVMLGDGAAAEAAAIGAIVRAIGRSSRIVRLDSSWTYSRSLLMRRCRTILHRRRSARLARRVIGFGNRSSARGQALALPRALETLSFRELACVALFFLDEADDRESADVLQCSPAVVRGALTKARTSFAGSSEGDPGDIDARVRHLLRAACDREWSNQATRAAAYARVAGRSRRRRAFKAVTVGAAVAIAVVGGTMAIKYVPRLNTQGRESRLTDREAPPSVGISRRHHLAKVSLPSATRAPFAVWPEVTNVSAFQNCARAIQADASWRMSPRLTAQEFGRTVLGWPDSSATGMAGRSLEVREHPGLTGDRGRVRILLRRVRGRQADCWEVASIRPPDENPTDVRVAMNHEYAHFVFSMRGAWAAEVSVSFGRATATVGTFHGEAAMRMPAGRGVTGSELILYRDASGKVFSAWGEPLAARG